MGPDQLLTIIDCIDGKSMQHSTYMYDESDGRLDLFFSEAYKVLSLNRLKDRLSHIAWIEELEIPHEQLEYRRHRRLYGNAMNVKLILKLGSIEAVEDFHKELDEEERVEYLKYCKKMGDAPPKKDHRYKTNIEYMNGEKSIVLIDFKDRQKENDWEYEHILDLANDTYEVRRNPLYPNHDDRIEPMILTRNNL